MSDKLTDEDYRGYEIFRRRIIDEDTLISARMNWLVWSQAALLASWTAIVFVSQQSNRIEQSQYNTITDVFLYGIPVAGILACIITFVSVQKALDEITFHRNRYRDQYTKAYASLKTPNITGRNNNHHLGHLTPQFLPFVFLSLNLYMLSYQIFK